VIGKQFCGGRAAWTFIVTVFIEATDVNHTDGINRQANAVYDVHTLDYKL